MSTHIDFDKVSQISKHYLQLQIDSIKQTCEKDPAVARMVYYILAHMHELDSTESNYDAHIGREIIQFIWQITGMDLSGISNPYHFDTDWAATLNHFIGNYIYDDSAFYFIQNQRTGVFSFKSSTDDDPWHQNADLLVEAAIANRQYFEKANSTPIMQRIGLKVDDTLFRQALDRI